MIRGAAVVDQHAFESRHLGSGLKPQGLHSSGHECSFSPLQVGNRGGLGHLGNTETSHTRFRIDRGLRIRGLLYRDRRRSRCFSIPGATENGTIVAFTCESWLTIAMM